MSGLSLGIDMSMNMGGGFSPFAVGRPIVFLDAAKGITLNGADVSDWADQSGEGNDPSQGTAADQPLFNVSDSNFNNNPSITFDGVSENLFRATFTGGEISQPNTVFIVYKNAVTTGVRTIFDGDTTRNMARVNAGNLQMFAGVSQTIHAANTNAHVLALLYNGASSDSWRDGIQGTPVGSPGASGMNGLRLGSDTAPSVFWNGEIAYFLIYDSNLSDIEKNYIGNGLAARFGTTWTEI